MAVQIQRRKYVALLQSARDRVATEGLLSLYHGITPTLLGMIPYAGTSFFVFDSLKHEIIQLRGDITTPERLMCGALAGIAGQFSSYPLDVVRRRMQTEGFLTSVSGDAPATRQYHGVWQTLKDIAQREGLLRGLYRGVSLNFIKGPMAVSISYTCFDLYKRALGV
jgi:solute carrier family 25, member 42